MRAIANVSNAEDPCITALLGVRLRRETAVGLPGQAALTDPQEGTSDTAQISRRLNQGKQAVAVSGIDQVPAKGIASE